MNIHDFAKQKPYLFWSTSTKNFDQLSEEAVVEGVLNYGDFDDVQTLLSLLGTKHVAKIFYQQINQRRVNYEPKIANYFKLYFAKHA